MHQYPIGQPTFTAELIQTKQSAGRLSERKTSDNHLHEDIILVRATPDVLLVLITESGSDNIYKRIGTSRRNLFTNKEKASTCVWELEGQKRILSLR